MILAFYYAEGHRAEGRWVPSGLHENEAALGPLPDGTYAVYVPTKTEIDEGPKVENPLPKSFTFDGFRESGTVPPKFNVKKVKK